MNAAPSRVPAERLAQVRAALDELIEAMTAAGLDPGAASLVRAYTDDDGPTEALLAQLGRDWIQVVSHRDGLADQYVPDDLATNRRLARLRAQVGLLLEAGGRYRLDDRPPGGELDDASRADFAAVAAELAAAGVSNGADFRVQDVEPDALSGRQYVGLRRLADGSFEVFRFELGIRPAIMTTADFATARARFVDEAIELAGHRWRGPHEIG